MLVIELAGRFNKFYLYLMHQADGYPDQNKK
ncbi:hypothetical protein DORLON_00996 [Dorea longicatena DSM 13814]|uniref:Uncharacterized protein n=1 Tax=Dorea longicatena DSM 13814 TaxID=411462 RepID=A6BFC4_9FIRM|nr:hypothetical protein DORLON_00996 [Dorea longicatena DSM 13814]